MTATPPPPRLTAFTEEQRRENERLVEELAELIASGEAVAFIGAGCSKSAGFDTWYELLEKLVARAEQLAPGFPPEPRPNTPREYLQYAQRIRDHIIKAVGPEGYHGEIGRIFSRPGGLDQLLTPFHLDLVLLPFRAFVTTNYEEIIETALRISKRSQDRPQPVSVWNGDPRLISPAIRALAVPDAIRHVLHLHGVHWFRATIVLCTEDYESAYGFTDLASNQAVRAPAPPTLLFRVISALLMSRRLVFIGFSLDDFYFTEVLRRVSDELWEWGQPIHFALVPIDAAAAVEQRSRAQQLKEKLAVECVFYEVIGGNHDERDKLVARLRADVERRRTLPAGPGPRPTAPADVVAPPLPEWVRETNAALRERIVRRAD